MGQQVRFQTLDQAAGLIHRIVESKNPVVLRRVRLGAMEVTRAEITHGSPGRCNVHVYEIYWAPLTEGKIGVWDVVHFLFRGGLAGIRSSLRGSFDRWLFGQWHRFRLPGSTTLGFVSALLVLGSLVILNLALGTVVAGAFVGAAGHDRWPSKLVVTDLVIGVSMLVVVGGLAFVAIRLSQLLRKKRARTPKILVSATWGLIWMAVLATVLGGALGTARLLGEMIGVQLPPWVEWPASLHNLLSVGGNPLLGITCALMLLVSRGVRAFMVQYVGDVAAYVSAHTLSRFDEIREQIRASAAALTHAVFEQPGPIAETLAYSRVVVLGHSLGSVIAYDALNSALRRDAMTSMARRVAERTALFLTMGSPLDKTAFIFRTQARTQMDLREAGAATMQPMIESYASRPRRWVNIYTPNDWIAGSLEYYDDPRDSQFEAYGVENILDPDATTPVAAHEEYWSGRTLRSVLAKVLT
jgi:hypothetical protein